MIFLTAPTLNWGQAVGMAKSVKKIVSMDPQVLIIAGSNDHLQSRGLLARLIDGSVLSNEVMAEAIMTLLSAMAEVQVALPPGTLHQEREEDYLCVVTGICGAAGAITICVHNGHYKVTTIAEGQFDVIMPAPNRSVDQDNYYSLRSELSAVWADISNAIQGLKEHSTTRVVLDDVLGLELRQVAKNKTSSR